MTLHRWYGGRRWGPLLFQAALLSLLIMHPLAPVRGQPAPSDSLSIVRERHSLFEQLRVGVALGVEWARQDVRFNVYEPDADSCGIFEGASRTGLAVSIFFETPLLPGPPLWLTSHLTFLDLSTQLAAPGRTDLLRRPDGEYVSVQTEHRYDLFLSAIQFSAGPSWEFFRGLRVAAEPSITFTWAGEPRQTEHIIQPLGVTFLETGSDVRPIFGAIVPDFRTVLFGIDFSIGGKIDLTERLAIHPEARLGIPFGSIAKNLSWHELGVGGSVGISYDFAPHRQPDTLELPPDNVPRPFLSATIKAYGVDEQGNRYDNPVIEIEETPWIESVPMIPFIFFDSAEVSIPARYVLLRSDEDADRYTVDSLLGISPMDIHYQILNVVGERMRKTPGVTLTISGTVSGDEVSLGGSRLGRERAETVARYLIEIWRIDPARIATEFVAHSVSASPEVTMEGRQENRRAELRFSDQEMAAPVVIHRLATIASPPSVTFSPTILHDTSIAEWYISVVQGEKELLRFEGDNSSTSLRQQKQWSLADLRVNRDLTPITYRLVVRDTVGQMVSDEGAFRIIERSQQRQIDSLGQKLQVLEVSIVGFGYNSADLLPRHLSQLYELAGSLSQDAKVTIIGYTDRVGEPDRNRALSLARARKVHESLRNSRVRRGESLPPSVSVVGLGSEREVFRNDLPEGRLLSRMVQITISQRAAEREEGR